MAETPTTADTPNVTGSLRRFGRKLLGNRASFLDRRYTPYTKTPKSARIPSSPENNRDFDEEESRDLPAESDSTASSEIKSLVGKTWRVYRVSPLYDFQYTTASFKTYAKSLSAFLEAETQVGNMAVELLTDSASGKFRVEFNLMKELTISESDSPAVKITIFSKQTGRQPTNDSPILTALFCSLGNDSSKDARPLTRRKFTFLPVCLVRGPAVLSRCFVSGLEAMFDCKISPMNFSSMDFAWFVSLWAGVALKEYSRPVELCYSLPASIKGLSRILYNIRAKDAKAIWNCVHENNSPLFTEKESDMFMKALETHFYHHFKVDLSRVALSRIGTSIVLVGSKGRLKLLHPKYVKHILQQITQSALIV